MAKKDRTKKIMLVSEGVNEKGRPTKSCYYMAKSNGSQEKLKLKKFDPYAYNPETKRRGMHVTYNEKKLPK